MGASLACSLAENVGQRHGMKIALLENRPPPPLAACLAPDRLPDPRVYALAPASVAFLESLGAWQLIKDRKRDYQYMQVWEGGGSGSIRFDAAKAKVMGLGSTRAEGSNGEGKERKKLGTMAENSTLQAALFQCMTSLQAQGLLEVLCPVQVEAIAFDTSGTDPTGPARVTWAGKDGVRSQVTTRLLVGADGAASRVKKARGLPSWGWDYAQRAVIATVSLDEQADAADAPSPRPSTTLSANKSSHSSSSPATAWQTFLPQGPLAFLPLWGPYHSIVWSTTPAEADRLKALPREAFLAELNAKLQCPIGLLDPPSFPSYVPQPLVKALVGAHHLVESVVVSAALSQGFHVAPIVRDVCGPRLSFDLRAEHASAYVGARAALVGDAAHTIHPMAGQGLNLGLADAMALSTLIEAGVVEGQDVGSPLFLRRYQNARQAANLGMLGGLTALHGLFGRKEGSWRWLRNVGLGTLNALDPVKAKMAEVAMGVNSGGGRQGM